MTNSIISLNAHPCSILNLNTPTKEYTNKSGRTVLVFDGENIQDWVLMVVEPSGLHVPQVKRLEPTISYIEINGVTIPVQVASGVAITDLPEPQEGVVYLTSFPSAQAARSLGRMDCITSGQLVFASYDEEKGAGVGILGCLGINAFA